VVQVPDNNIDTQISQPDQVFSNIVTQPTGRGNARTKLIWKSKHKCSIFNTIVHPINAPTISIGQNRSPIILNLKITSNQREGLASTEGAQFCPFGLGEGKFFSFFPLFPMCSHFGTIKFSMSSYQVPTCPPSSHGVHQCVPNSTSPHMLWQTSFQLFR
jgi:hypothetical protein